MSLDPSPVPHPAPPVDGRQSQNALKVRRGTCRLLRLHGFSALPEVGLASGRRADLVVLDAPSHVHLAYRPGVPLVRAVYRRGVALQ